jgi:type IV secretion system protein VirB4
MAPAYTFPLLGPVGDDFVLARDGSLWAVVELDGVDPDGLDAARVSAVTCTARNAIAALPSGAQRQEFYFHYRAPPPPPPPNAHPVVARLEAARHAHLLSKRMYRSRLFHAIGIPTTALSSRIGAIDAVTTVLLSPFDRAARSRLVRWASRDAELTYIVDGLERGRQTLRDIVDTYRRRWSSFCDSALLDTTMQWRIARALAEIEPTLLDRADVAPVDHWYAGVLRGEVPARSVDGAEYLKSTTHGRYARIASVARLARRVVPGFWTTVRPALLTADADFIAATNARVLTPLQSALTFKQLRDDVSRSQINLLHHLAGGAAGEGGAPDAETAARRERAASDQREISEAERLDEFWHRASLSVVALGDSASGAREAALVLDSALAAASVHAVWETPGLHHAYEGAQLGAKPFPPRALLLNSTQCAAASLAYAHNRGVRIEAERDRALIVLETADGQPFGFSPFVGERGTVIGLGPSRSGKTFLKNALAAAWPRWAGSVVCLDYDVGSECLATLYGRDAGVFAGNQGLNPFAAGEYTNAFRAHFTRLLRAMLASNDAAGLKEIELDEQPLIDAALERTLALPAELRRLSILARHLTPQTAAKLARWLAEPAQGVPGRYATLLDNATDRIGAIDRLVTVFNLTELRDDTAARAPVLLELLWRVSAAFEDPARRHLPKKVVLDEAHLALRDASVGDFTATKARTWNKWNASVELWNHQVEEYGDLHAWDALRGSASTFIFTAAPDAITDKYCDVMRITPADVEVIRSLTPKRELYVIQPDLNLRKRLVLDPDAEALRWAASSPGGAHHGAASVRPLAAA